MTLIMKTVYNNSDDIKGVDDDTKTGGVDDDNEIGDYDGEEGNGNDDNDDDGDTGEDNHDGGRDDDDDGDNDDKTSCVGKKLICRLNDPPETSDCSVSVQSSSEMSLVSLFLGGV